MTSRNNRTYENGRRYYGFKPEFLFPDDKTAAAAHLAIGTNWYQLLDGRAFVAPLSLIKKNHKFLEFAIRSGSRTPWVPEAYHPSSRLIGVDVTYVSLNIRYFDDHGLEGD